MTELGAVSLAIIALVYVVFIIGAFVGIVILIKLYFDLRKKIDRLRKELEPYQSKVDNMLYKVEQIMDIAEELTKDVRELGNKTKESGLEIVEKAKSTSLQILDKTKDSVDGITSLVADTRKRVKSHTDYLFGRIESIEEKIDEVYAFLVGVTKFTSKFIKKED